jgi:Arc/MetJ-type ribon-helix-helix transcriptional regulator
VIGPRGTRCLPRVLGLLRRQLVARRTGVLLLHWQYLTAPIWLVDFVYYLTIFSTMESMRTTAPLSITLPPDMLKRAKKLAGKENRTMSELIREALRRYEQATDQAEIRRQALMEFKRVLADVREDARRAGTARLTMRQLDKEIAAGRAERRRRSSLLHSPK